MTTKHFNITSLCLNIIGVIIATKHISNSLW